MKKIFMKKNLLYVYQKNHYNETHYNNHYNDHYNHYNETQDFFQEEKRESCIFIKI